MDFHSGRQILINQTPLLDLRSTRARSVAHVIMQIIEPYIENDRHLCVDDCRPEVYEKLVALLSEKGIEVLTDDHREKLGLPLRNDQGWTIEEIIALEQKRLELLSKPPMLPADWSKRYYSPTGK